MKKIIFILILATTFSNQAFAAWTCSKTGSRQDSDTLTITLSCTNGVVTVIDEVPVFRPQTKLEIQNALDNRTATVRDRVQAINRITNTIKPTIDADNSMQGTA